jgi:hypothetical protein
MAFRAVRNAGKCKGNITDNVEFGFISAPGRATYGSMSFFALAALARRRLSRYASDSERK